LGNERNAAYRLFESLEGSQDLSAPLHIDLMETVDDLPEKIKTMSCSLKQVGANCQLIARDVFRFKNLEELI
jgi:hypothetical protein